MYKKIRLLALFVCLIHSAYAETPADSLSRVLTRKDLLLKDRITTMGLLARALCVTDSERAMRIEKEAMQLCSQLKNPATTAYSWSIMALLRYYYNNRDITKAREAADSSLFYARLSNDPLSLGIAWHRTAWVESLQLKLKEAVKSSLEGLKYLEDIPGNTYEANLYYIIADAYATWADLPRQGKYAGLCLDAALKSNDYDNLLTGHQAVAAYYHSSFKNNNQNPLLLDSAVIHYRKGIDLYKTHPEKVVFKGTVAVIALNVARLYQQYKIRNYQDSVVPYLNLALQTAMQIKQAEVIAGSFGLMSEVEIEKGNYQQAETLLQAGLSSLFMDDTNHNRYKVQLLWALTRVAEKQGDHAKALRYYKDYHRFYEDIFDADKLKIARDLEEKYQSEKKEQAIKTLNQQNALNRKMNYLYAFIALLMVVSGLYIFRSYHFRLKASLHQKKLLQQEKDDADLLARIKQQEIKQLELEKQEAALTAQLKEAETLRLQAEQKLLQEREERLQKDLLAVNLQVEQKDELLHTVQKKIEESTGDRAVVKKINNIIDQNKRSDDAFANNKADFDTVRPEFFQQLKEQSADKLSRLDLKHCAYISIGLTNKEIAQRLNVVPKSILMARYRIKIKLGLGKDDDLDAYIAKLS